MNATIFDPLQDGVFYLISTLNTICSQNPAKSRFGCVQCTQQFPLSTQVRSKCTSCIDHTN